jgi:hypothetical protein
MASKNASFNSVSIPSGIPSSSAALAVSGAHSAAVSQGLDILQVVSAGGKVVWNMNSAGVIATNPASPTRTAHLGQFEGSSFSAAFPDPTNAKSDFYQITQGSKVVYRIDYQGNSFTS